MILATKSGWLISCELVRETPKAAYVKARDENKERRIPKNSETSKLFDCVKKAEKWIKAK